MPGIRLLLLLAIAAPLALIAAADELTPGEHAEYRFVRLAYNSNGLGGYGYRGGRKWQTDMPDAEYHLLQGISRLTRVDAASEPHVVSALSDDLFDYPWIYAVEVGYWSLNEQEAARLRDYLLRGGFLMVDDFHGTIEWATFVDTLTRVFPDRPIVEIPENDETFHVHFDLDNRIQIPGRMFIRTGQTWERDGYTPHWRGVYDDDGRLMVAINFNMDMGDAWEHADWPEYPEQMTALAYRFAVNYLIYAMTH